jgi:NAD kinase
MEVFGIIGMSLGTMGFLFALTCLGKMKKLIKDLKAKGILEEDYKEN